MTTEAVPKVYAAIAAVASELCEKGVGKTRHNPQQDYRFRGIDDFYNALAPALARHHLCILPRCLSREKFERTTQKGGILTYTVIAAEFDFVSAEDGSKHTVGPFYGEAMDSADKSTNKAMSAAYKYCVMQAFSVPVAGQTIDSEVDGVAPEPDLDSALVAAFEAAASPQDVARAWNAIPRDSRSHYRLLKDKALWRVSPQEPSDA